MTGDTAKARVQHQFGTTAAAYATSEVHALGESLGALLAACPAAPSWSALDVATGAGHTALAFAPSVRQVIAFDLTRPMLEQTAALARARGLANVSIQEGDAEALPFPDATFDLVTCRLACHHFPHPEQAIAEMARVLRPGGMLGFTDNVTVADPVGARHYDAYERLRDPSHHEVVSIGRLIDRFEAAGFRIDLVQRLQKEMEFQDWANRMRVTDADKITLLELLRSMPASLRPLLAPRFADDTAYFTLWEAVVVAQKPA